MERTDYLLRTQDHKSVILEWCQSRKSHMSVCLAALRSIAECPNNTAKAQARVRRVGTRLVHEVVVLDVLRAQLALVVTAPRVGMDLSKFQICGSNARQRDVCEEHASFRTRCPFFIGTWRVFRSFTHTDTAQDERSSRLPCSRLRRMAPTTRCPRSWPISPAHTPRQRWQVSRPEPCLHCPSEPGWCHR